MHLTNHSRIHLQSLKIIRLHSPIFNKLFGLSSLYKEIIRLQSYFLESELAYIHHLFSKH